MKTLYSITSILLTLIFSITNPSFSQEKKGSILLDETDQQEIIQETIHIDNVWAGHPVGFALLTEKNKQYIAYYNENRHTVVGQRTLDQSSFSTFTLPPKERLSRDGTSTILGWDSHNYLTLAIDKDGYIHLSGNMHVNGLTYFRSQRPWDITSLIQIERMVGTEEKRCTYPKFIKTVDGELIFRYRDGGSGNGNNIYNTYDRETQSWKRLHSTPLIDGGGLMNAYSSSPQLGPDGWYHIYWVWRDTPDCSTNHDLSYMKSPDMVHWFNAYGESVALPITFQEKSLIVDPIPVKGGIINLAAKLCFDKQNTPIFTYHKYDADGNLQLYTAKLQSNKWDIQQITDWDYRWEFSGNGSINKEFFLNTFERREDENYEISYEHIKYGAGTLLLDSSLRTIGQVQKSPRLASSLELEGEFPDLGIQIAHDLGKSSEAGIRFILKWETLPRNRDKPRPKPWPAPSKLYLLQLGKNQSTPLLDWRDIRSPEDVFKAYPERMQTLLQSLDLSQQDLEDVGSAYKNNDIPKALESLLLYFQKRNQASFLQKQLPKVSSQSIPEAEEILNDIITVQREAGKAPRDSAGHLDWHFQGPNNDKEWAWGLNRHYHLQILFDAYFKTGNSTYVKAIDQHIKDWVIKSLPYPEKKSSTAMWRGLEVSFRVKTWAKIFHDLINHPDLSPATRLLLLSSIPEHAHYARNYHAAGNWLTMEMSGLAMAATAWTEFQDAKEWLSYAKDAMIESMKEQIYPDGVQTELTSHYHYVALNNFNQFLDICEQAQEPLPTFYTETIEKMWDYLAYSMRPDGYGILNNDSDRDYNRNRIKAIAEQYNRADWKYIGSQGKTGTQPKQLSKFYPWAGQAIMRSGFDKDAHWAFFDIGPWGSGHQHNDKLHLSISAFGNDFLVDAGRFAYRGAIAQKFRPYARSSQSHNTIRINNKSQSPGPKLAESPLTLNHFISTDAYDYAWNVMDHFKELGEKNTHKRAVYYQRGKFWIVVDRVTIIEPSVIETLWHWHPGCKVKTLSKNKLHAQNDGGNLFLIPIGNSKLDLVTKKGQESPELMGWYSEKYNQVEPTTTTIYTSAENKTKNFIWLLYPSKAPNPKLKAKILDETEEGIVVRVKDEEGSWEISIPYASSKGVELTKN